ncbi:hypothetical protein C3L50_11400 [Flavobacterium alvei]|uniref:DUF4062 domain-containing protein n=2 Tax=Flavobacterium alvei TaxID=2080416 RepID=A0A2S5A8J6_9FLAO|nr:hypothetical protein C3L50_11400 [Flavobacterium alvei]
MGKHFSQKEFDFTIEENNLDAFWSFCKKEILSQKRGYLLLKNEDYTEVFIFGLNYTYEKYIHSFEANKIQIKKHFNYFFNICFKFFIEKNKLKKDFSKIIDAIKSLEIFEKDIISFIPIENEESKEYLDAEIIFDKDPFIKKFHSTKKYQIFISSTFTDLINERQAAVEAILKKGHIPAGMELFSANNKSQWEVIKKWIDDSDIYVLILGGRYGSIDNSTGLSYTEMEYNYAIEKGKPFFALILGKELLDNKDVDIIKDYDLKDPKYIAFKKFVTSKMCSFPKNLDQIKLEIVNSLDTIISDNKNKMKGWMKGYIDDEIDFVQVYNNEKK